MRSSPLGRYELEIDAVSKSTLCENRRAHSDEFEMCPDWVPGMDTIQRVARITLKPMSVYGFDYRANRVAKVRNVSRLGRQLLLLQISAI
jgi:hypothetical protein